jgi:predicted phosphodiesterase
MPLRQRQKVQGLPRPELILKLQILSDLHLETEDFTPQAAPDAELLVLAGDVDARWDALAHFANWPVPVVFVPGNHEFDGRDVLEALPQLRQRCEQLGLHLLAGNTLVLPDAQGRQVQLVGVTRWCDFNLFGEAQRNKAMRAASYYLRYMNASRGGQPLDAPATRELGLAERAWLARVLKQARTEVDATVVITHFGPSAKSADPRYGLQPSSASFCNADDDLLPLADLWIHGHLHCRHDYRVAHDSGETRVICNPRGHSRKGEADGFNGLFTATV